MTDAPERIWVATWREGDWREGDWDDNEGKTLNDKPCIEYVRADHIKALTKERDQHWDSFVHWRKEADALTEQLEAARADAKEAEAYAMELEAKVKSLTKHHANMADPRYWEGRYRDEKNLLAKAVGALRQIADPISLAQGNVNAEIARATLEEIKGERR